MIKSIANLVTAISILLLTSTINMANAASNNTANDYRVGVQLWSVKDKLKEDFKGTITSLAGMGFEGLEFAGHFGEFENDPVALKAFLKKHNLVASGAHISFDDLTPDNIEKTLRFYKALGASYLVVPWDERAWDPEKVDALVAQINELHPIVSKAGFAFGYHNHDQEFNDYQGLTFWDHIARNTLPESILQLDIGWVNYAKKDAIHFVKSYPGRTLTTHFKVRTHEGENKSVILGEDGYAWSALLEVMQEFGGTKWVIVEQEEYLEGVSSVETIRQSKAGFDSIVKKAKAE